jgi:hypothetical protein
MGTVVACVFFLASPALAGKIRVPKDQPTIQDAVNAAQNGDTIEVSSGRYDEAVTIAGKDNLTIAGKGKATLTGNSARISVDDCDGVTIKGLTFENTGDEGIDFEDVTSLKIEKCTFKRTGDDAISGNSAAGLVISKCTIDDPGDDGVDVDDSSDVVIEKCKVRKIDDNGLQLDGIDGGKIEKNQIDDCGNDGIALSVSDSQNPSRDLLVAKNKIRRCGDDGIDSFGSRIKFEKNKISDCREDGIDVSDGDFSGNEVLKNKISKVDEDGINLGGSDGVAEKNQIKSAGDDGIDLQGRGHRVEKNKIKGADDVGILAQRDVAIPDRDEGAHRILSNDIQNATIGLLLEDLPDGSEVDKNKVKKAGAIGFDINGPGSTFTRNDVRGSKDVDLDDSTGEGSNDYADSNKFGTENIYLDT